MKRKSSARFELVKKKSVDLSQVRKLGAVAMSQVRDTHGVVFEHGSADATPVHCVQRHFFSTDPDDAASVAFAEALDDVRWR